MAKTKAKAPAAPETEPEVKVQRFNASSVSYNSRLKIADMILENMHKQRQGNGSGGILLAGDPGTGKCLTGENTIELFVNDDVLFSELQEFLQK